MFGNQWHDCIPPNTRVQKLEAENARLREELAAAQAAVKKYSDLLRICRLSNLSQELDVAIDNAMKEVGHEQV